MRVAVLSDIHANAEALQAVLRDLRNQRDVEQIVLLGDILTKGPQCREVLEIVRDLAAVMVRGNGESGLDFENPFADVPLDIVPGERREMERWFREQLTEDDLSFLKGLPKSYTLKSGVHKWHFIHASRKNTIELIFPDEKSKLLALFSDPDTTAVIYGHIHRAFMRIINGRYVLNAGSVGQPLDGDTRASYLIITAEGRNLSAEFRRVEYDLEVPIRAAYRRGMPGAETYEWMIRNARYPYR